MNIFKIFVSDSKGLFKNFFALIIAAGLCILPALYAWFNIYANWNPYGNTGNISFAVVNLDKGGKDTEGNEVNMGDSIVDKLKESDSIGWQFIDDDSKAEEGVKSGKYYAAIVINDNFTECMYDGIYDSTVKPSMTYYVNDKKNAVATKITDTAVNTLQNTINKTYVETVTKLLLDKTNVLSSDITENLGQNDAVDEFIDSLQAISTGLDSYSTMIDTLIKGNESITSATDDVIAGLNEGEKAIDESSKIVDNAKTDVSSVKDSFNDFNTDISKSMTTISTSIDNIQNEIDNAGLEKDSEALLADIDQIVTDSNSLSDDIDDMEDILNTLYNESLVGSIVADAKEKIDATAKGQEINSRISAAKGILDQVQVKLNGITTGIVVPDKSDITDKVTETLSSNLKSYSDTIGNIKQMYDDQVTTQINGIIDNLSASLTTVDTMLKSLKELSPEMISVFNNVNDTVDVLDTSLAELKISINDSKTQIDEMITTLKSTSEDEKLILLVSMLTGDADTLSSFLASPVSVEDNYVYEIKNYGSGVAPFYTTLAIWVGMTILVSLIKVHADTKDLIKPRQHQLYIGRYILFFLLSQIQTLIIVLGDLYILKIQCLYPMRFWFAAAVASTTFSLIVYTLTISFGDIGKALAVVIMVIQIAGSGGTYPIEALPTFFKNIYIFFPFPYAIDAMRECIGGMYEDKYEVMLFKLGLFCFGALVVGLVIRKPFIQINHYIEKRMEDTKVL